MSLSREEKFQSVMTIIGSILGLITGFLYFGLGGAILGFIVGGVAFVLVAQFLNKSGYLLGCLLQIAFTCILIVLLWGKFAPTSLFKSDHNDEKNMTSNSEVSTEDKTKSIDIQNETKSKEKTIPYEAFTEDKSKRIDNPNRAKSEPNKSPVKDLIELSSIDYPASFLTISDSQFLAADGKETVIPANTRILILKRTPAGMLTLEVNGKTYLGYESRLNGNIKK